jgi:flagellar hook protein FlgE
MSFQQGLSGLNTSSKNLDVIGNNVANAQTVGFKGSQAQFADVYAASLTGAAGTQIGLGAKLSTVAQYFTQGNISVSNNPLDMAINGKGFFRMSDNGAVTYTRNGQFQTDKQGYIVDSGGRHLTGYGVTTIPDPNNPTATIDVPDTGTPLDLRIDPNAQSNPKQSANAVLTYNLDSRLSPPTLGFVPTSATPAPQTYNSATSVQVYDSLGNAHSLTSYFVKLNSIGGVATPNAWAVFMSLDGAPINNGVNNTVDIGTSAGASLGQPLVMQFNTDGTLNTAAGYRSGGTYNGATQDVTGGTTFASNPPPMVRLYLDRVATALGKTNGATTPVDISFDMKSSTQFGADFAVSVATQDGYASGKLSGFSISPNGGVLARYTNGQTTTLGYVRLTNFPNPQGLLPMGNNQWIETSASGQPVEGTPGVGSFGVTQSGAVEDSNVDLTQELVNMITAQRVYQANAQTIKTQDQVLNTLVNLR